MILFRKGKIIYVASSSIRETLGSLLVRQGMVSQADLDKALELQHQAKTETRLGTILSEMGVVPEEVVAKIIEEQTARAFSEFLAWPGGYFSYHPMDFPDCGEVEVDVLDFISEDGIRSDQMLLEIADRLDQIEGEQAGSQDDIGSISEPPAEDDRDESVTEAVCSPSFASLKISIEEIRSPYFTGEISNQIAGFAEKLFDRWVLFMVARNGFRVTAESIRLRSLPEGEGESEVTNLVVPVDEPTVLSEVLGRKETIVGPLTTTDWNLMILDFVGGSNPNKSVAVPLTVNGQVLAILYAAHLKKDAGPNWLAELEMLFMQIGLTVERDLVERQAEHLSLLRSHSSGLDVEASASLPS